MLKFGHSVIVRVPSNSPRYRARTIAEEVQTPGAFHQASLHYQTPNQKLDYQGEQDLRITELNFKELARLAQPPNH
jgi:hypothetical protein